VAARPYAYELPLARTALVMVDFQRDFLEEGGFGAALGNDVALLKVGLGCGGPGVQVRSCCRGRRVAL
jgi:nicotinamidase-related amidase